MTLRDVGKSVGDAMLRQAGRFASRVQEKRPLAADLLESEDAYLVVFDTPGAVGSDVQVRYVDGSVLVRVDRFRDFYEGFEMRFPGRGMALDGEVKLPDDAVVDAEAATARLTENGTLQVEVPKAEGTVDHAVAVEDASEDADTAAVGDDTDDT